MVSNDGWQAITTGYDLSYKSRWDRPWFIVREFLQNAADEHDCAGITELPEIFRENGKVIIADKGSGIGAEALLLRETKAKQGLRGSFGEGMKWACICALRLGLDIRVLSPHVEIYPSVKKTSLGRAENVELVVFNWRERDGAEGEGTRVEISGLTKLYRKGFFCFLQIPEKRQFSIAHNVEGRTRYNSVSLMPAYENWLFVRDIFTREIGDKEEGAREPKSRFCYNLWDVELDPDRMQLQNPSAMGYRIKELWAYCDRVPLLRQLLQAIVNSEYEAALQWNWEDPEHPEKWKLAWLNLFGPHAILQTDQVAATQCRHLGYQVIELPSQATAFLAKAIKTDKTIIKERVEDVIEKRKIVNDEDIPDSARENLEILRWMAPRVYERLWKSGENIQVIAANLPPTATGNVVLGGIEPPNTVFIAPSVLQYFPLALAVFVHEAAHLLNPDLPDDSLGHARHVDLIWRAAWMVRHGYGDFSMWDKVSHEKFGVEDEI